MWSCTKYTMFIVWISRCVCHLSPRSLNKFYRREKSSKTATNARQTCRASSWKKGRHSFCLPPKIGHLGSSEERLCRMGRSMTVTWVPTTRTAACPRTATCTVVRSLRVLYYYTVRCLVPFVVRGRVTYLFIYKIHCPLCENPGFSQNALCVLFFRSKAPGFTKRARLLWAVWWAVRTLFSQNRHCVLFCGTFCLLQAPASPFFYFSWIRLNGIKIRHHTRSYLGIPVECLP
jgi:hypothetical protein